MMTVQMIVQSKLSRVDSGDHNEFMDLMAEFYGDTGNSEVHVHAGSFLQQQLQHAGDGRYFGDTKNNNNVEAERNKNKTAKGGINNNDNESNSNNNSKTITNCGCPSTCTPQKLQEGNSNFSCQARIQNLISKHVDERQACIMSSKASISEDPQALKPCPMECHPDVCHTLPPPSPPKQVIDCGCPHSCTYRSLHKRNPNNFCIDRILHLMNKKNLPELEACGIASQTTMTLNYFNSNHNTTATVSSEGDNYKDIIDWRRPCEYECHPQICTNLTGPIHQNVNVDHLNLPKQGKFHRYDNVVIVTKVLSSANINQLIQMLCLFNAAYNRFVHYDIVVFTTIPFGKSEIQMVQDIVQPATLKVITEGKSLQQHLHEMTPQEIQNLNQRCNVKDNETITWNHHCTEENSRHVSSLGYAWQAEFRSYHLWTHKALESYKYMMWIDADAMCTKTWDNDPIKVMIENDLILMFDQFPAGCIRGEALKEKIKKGYGDYNDDQTGQIVCKVGIDHQKGTLTKEYCENDNDIPSIQQVFGFNHITNLDVYRQPKHQKFLKEMITNDYKFSRMWDDQLAVTLPAVMEDPSRCWDYRTHGLHMGIHHNGRIDGKEHSKYTSYLNFWSHEVKYVWPAARAMCDGLVTTIS